MKLMKEEVEGEAYEFGHQVKGSCRSGGVQYWQCNYSRSLGGSGGGGLVRLHQRRILFCAKSGDSVVVVGAT